MRREARIPHRRGCYEPVKELDKISGEIVESFVVNYAKLEPETSFTNASKIRYPATLFHCGKVFRPVENSMGKIKGECKKRDKNCVVDTRYCDAALVDPELPSSFKAREIASRLAESEELAIPQHIVDSDAASDSSGASSGTFRAPRGSRTRVYSSSRTSLIDVLRATSRSEWPGNGPTCPPHVIPRKARKRAVRCGSLRYSSSPVPCRSEGDGSNRVWVGLAGVRPEVQRHRLSSAVAPDGSDTEQATSAGMAEAVPEDWEMSASPPSDISSLCNLSLGSRSLEAAMKGSVALVDDPADSPQESLGGSLVEQGTSTVPDTPAAIEAASEEGDTEGLGRDWDMVSVADSEDWDFITDADHDL